VDTRPDRFALPLAGVPVAVKDTVDVAGYPTRHGSAASSTQPARRDDELVRRLRAAGATIGGKTRMPELASWGFTPLRTRPHSPPARPDARPGRVQRRQPRRGRRRDGRAGAGTHGGARSGCRRRTAGRSGFEPGADVVSLPGEASEHWCGMSAAGPIARTAADAVLMFAVLARRPAEPLVEGADPPARVALSLRSPSRSPGCDPALARRRARDVAALGLDPAALEPRTAAIARKGRRLLRPGSARPGGLARTGFWGG
jgi:amidase